MGATHVTVLSVGFLGIKVFHFKSVDFDEKSVGVEPAF